jgi:hypothetical protein
LLGWHWLSPSNHYGLREYSVQISITIRETIWPVDQRRSANSEENFDPADWKICQRFGDFPKAFKIECFFQT